MSSVAILESRSHNQGDPLYVGGDISPYIMNLDIYVQSKMVYFRDPPIKDDELDVEAVMKEGSIELITPVRAWLSMPSLVPGNEGHRIGVFFIPPGGGMTINGVRVHNGGTEDQAAYAFCPKCGNWWIKKTPERPKRCPECNARLDKYKDSEIELREVMKQDRKFL